MSGEVRLTWEGRRAADIPPNPPLLLRDDSTGETSKSLAQAQLGLFDEDTLQASESTWRHRLIHGDNLAAMAALQKEFAGQFDLIYLDPPFFTGREFSSRKSLSRMGIEIPVWRVGGPTVLRAESPGEFTPIYTDAMASENQQSETQNPMSYSDAWVSLGAYLQWLFDRLTAAHALLSETGCLYLHLSWHSVHYAKLLLDEVFGVERFQNEIVWCYREAINSKKRWNRKHDTLLFYSKGEQFTFNYDAVREPYAESNVRKYRNRDEKGMYRLMGRGITSSPLRSKRDLPAEYEHLYPGLTYRHYLGEGTLAVDYWRIDIENQASALRTGYPTQKPEALLEKILLASTNPGDLIGDFCCGSGTTLAVAERLGRQWIGCDAGDSAIAVSAQRLKGLNSLFDRYSLVQSGAEQADLRDAQEK